MSEVPAADVHTAEVPAAEVRAVLGAPEPTRVTPLVHNHIQRVTAGIWRVGAGDRSAVLKVLSGAGAVAEPTHWQPSSDPSHWNWWRREAEVHRSGLVDRVYGGSGVRAPKMLGCFERSVDSLALWTEEVTGEVWTVARAGPVATAWGRAQGAASTADARSTPLTSRRFLRTYCETMPVRGDLRDPRQWESPLVDWVAEPVRHGLARLHDEQDWFFSVMEHLPARSVTSTCGPTTCLVRPTAAWWRWTGRSWATAPWVKTWAT